MNRTLFFLSLVGVNLITQVMERSIINADSATMIYFVLFASILAAGCYRWQHMGYHPAWGLLTMIPFVSVYGLLMPKDAKTNGIDTFGKIWAGVIIFLVTFVVIMTVVASS